MKLIALAAVVITLALTLTAAASSRPSEPVLDPGNPNSYCAESVAGKQGWFTFPGHGYAHFVCNYQSLAWHDIERLVCSGCTDDAPVFVEAGYYPWLSGQYAVAWHEQ